MNRHNDFRKNIVADISEIVGSQKLAVNMQKYYNDKHFYNKLKEHIEELADDDEKKLKCNEVLLKYADSIQAVKDEVVNSFEEEYNSLMRIITQTSSKEVEAEEQQPSETHEAYQNRHHIETQKPMNLEIITNRLDEKNKMIGKVLDDTFEIVSVIKEGGEAIIYKAKIISHQKYMDDKEVGIGDFVAIREYKKPDENIKKGIKALSESKHKKNIVKYIYSFDDSGIKYVVTEFIDGMDLMSINKRLFRNFSPEEALTIAYDLGIALKDVHDNGIVHCDINPKNIMIAKSGELKLIDFGLAHYVSSGRRKETLGTVHYLSPQQIIGDIDYRTDIYAIGPLLFELLTGKKLFDDREKDVEKRIEKIKNKIMVGFKPSLIKDYLCDTNSHKTEDAFVYDIILKSLETAGVKDNKKIPINEAAGFRNIDEFLFHCRKALKNYNIYYVVGESNPEDLGLEIPLPEPPLLYNLRNYKRRELMNEITLPGKRWTYRK